MNPCNRAPAIENAAQYIEGTLSQLDAERFEDHYWNCPACLAYLQALEAVGDELAREPLPQIAPPPPRRVIAWPVPAWALGAVAAAAVLAVIGIRTLGPRQQTSPQAQTAPTASQQNAQSPQIASSPVRQAASQLADLTLPPFSANLLRGAGMDAHFEQGMAAYSRGDCKSALTDLAKVPAHDKQGTKAEFYSALCHMHQGDLAAAEAGLQKVVEAGDSLQLESAFYYLAQIHLAQNDPAGAHQYLVRTISLQGDMEKQARLQDQKVQALEKMSRDAGATDGK
jgi:tetratricopeptide (TPR) repeat protein